MRHILLSVVLSIVVLTVSGCGAIGGGPTPTPTAKPTLPATPTSVPTAVPPTATPTPIPPTPVPPTPTPVPPQATTKQQVNLRAGPGVEFAISGRMPQGVNAIILGKNEDAKWFQLAYPDAKTPSWVASSFVTVTGSIDQLQVVAVAPPPTPTKGAAVATKAAAATPTQVVPPAKGVVGFVATGNGQYILDNFRFDGRTISEFKSLGPSPADLRTGSGSLYTNAPPFAWAPDGSGRVVFVYGPGTTNVLRLISGEVQTDLAGAESILNPVWSSDGKKIFYIGIDKGVHAIYSIDAVDRKAIRFFPARSGENFRGLSYGKSLLFVSNLTGAWEIWRMNIGSDAGSGAVQVTNDKRENGSPAWSPDGSRFAYYSKQVDGTYQIMVANADGTNPRKLTNAASNWTPAWSPDGNWIAFASNRGGKMGVYIMDKNGGNVQLLTDKFAPEALSPGSWR